MSRRMCKKRVGKPSVKQMIALAKKINEQEQAMKRLSEAFDEQQEILQLYYKTYQEMKRQNQQKYLMGYIRMRDDMLKDVERMKASECVDENTLRLFAMYIDELDALLEDNGVEILNCCENEEYNPEIQKPLERIDTERAELNNKVVRVFGCGYRWNGIILKKAYVAVGVYNQ